MQLGKEGVSYTTDAVRREWVGQPKLAASASAFSAVFLTVEVPTDGTRRLPTCPVEMSFLSSTTILPRCEV